MPVKVLLRESLAHLGDQGDIVSVAPGYARNFLLPKGLAIEATAGNLKMLESKRKVWDERKLREIEAAKLQAEKISGLTLKVARKSGPGGTLYGSVTKAEIHQLLEAAGIEVDRRRLVVEATIKTTGDHEITVKIHSQVRAQFKLQVLAEETTG
jgi:large subunit ribosomal protein L9